AGAVVERELRAAPAVVAVRVRASGDAHRDRLRARDARRAKAARVDAAPFRGADAVLADDGAVAVAQVARSGTRRLPRGRRVHPARRGGRIWLSAHDARQA